MGMQLKTPKGWMLKLRAKHFEAICDENTKLFREKNAEYGDSTLATGVVGAVTELVGCVARLVVLVLQSPNRGKDNRQQIIDKLRDTHNYANIAMMQLEYDNWEGDPGWLEREAKDGSRESSTGV